jgi:hypothetical protein
VQDGETLRLRMEAVAGGYPSLWSWSIT